MPIVPVRHGSPTTARAAFALVALIVLAGCATTTSGQAVKATPATPTAQGTGTLSKAAFVTAANGLCKSVDLQRSALPTPTGPTDYSNIVTSLQGTLRLFPPYLARVKVLVAMTADRVDLTSKWVSIEEADYLTGQPVLVRTLTAALAQDATMVNQDLTELATLPDHSKQIAAFMTGYGLTDCAALETS